MNDEGFLWDSDKLALVRKEHDVTMLEAIEVTFDDNQLADDDPQGNWERYMVIGKTSSGRILQLICVQESECVTRFVTAFDANDYWRNIYEDA